LIYINSLLFFIIALVYSSAGFGGGSLYLAILSETGWSTAMIATTGLVCNLLVTLVSSVRFQILGLIEWKKTALFLLLSFPFAYIAGAFSITDRFFFLTLATCLLIAAILMVVDFKKNISINERWVYAALPVIGIMSGITGIGGGIYLAPLLHLSRWSDARRIAALTSVFIMINSLAGLAARKEQLEEMIFEPSYFLLPLAAVVGGAIGSRLSASILEPNMIRKITAGILAFAAIKIYLSHL
jgi:uncharacterized membrane protein YfcA